jgi:hypothetical protein
MCVSSNIARGTVGSTYRQVPNNRLHRTQRHVSDVLERVIEHPVGACSAASESVPI